jgi:hypothetical protein
MFVYVFKGPAVSRANNIREIHAGQVGACATNFPAAIASTKLMPQTGYEKLFRTLCSKLQIKILGSVISLA